MFVGLRRKGGTVNVYKGYAIQKTVEVTALYSAFEADFENGYSFVGEAHDFWEMVYVKRGRVGVLAGDRIYNLTEGMIVLHPPMEFHRIWSEQGEMPAVIVMSFSAKWAAPPVNNVVLFDRESNTLTPERVKDAITTAFEMNGRAVVGTRGDSAMQPQTAVAMLEELLMGLSNRDQSAQPDKSEPSNSKYAQIVRVLDDNMDRMLELGDIAEMCNMSVSNLKRIFYKYAGMGLIHYYNELKARKAILLLGEGLSVKETAARLGFSDQNYFSYFFKRIMGKSPTVYMRSVEKKR